MNDYFQIPSYKQLKSKDIFICCSSGSKNHLGKVAFVHNDTSSYAGGFMGIIRAKAGNEPKYLYYLLNTVLKQTIQDIGICSTGILVSVSGISKFLKYTLLSRDLVDQASRLMRGVSLPRIKTEAFLNLKIPLPSLNEQQKIIKEIEKIEDEITELENQLKAMPTKKEYILKSYLM